jgi:hypothetical protein
LGGVLRILDFFAIPCLIRRHSLSVLPALFLCAISVSWAAGAPTISAVEGKIADGSAITISGSGFGAVGPNVVLFDDYEKGKDGSRVSTAKGASRVGQWTEAIGDITYSTSYAHSGIMAAQSEWRNAGSGRIPQTRLNFPGSTSVFLSWWQYLPADRDVPGTNNPDRPNWKLFWLWSDPFPGSDYLTVLLGRSTYAIAGDDTAPPARSYNPKYISTRFNPGKWMRYQFYFKGGQTDGAIEYAELTGSGLTTIIDAARLNTIRPGSSWNRLTIPGYGRRDHNSQTYVDDVYVAEGPGARARVEIGDEESYRRCTKLTLATPLSWGDDGVTAIVRQGGFAAGVAAYLFVINSAGEASAGFPILTKGPSEVRPEEELLPLKTGPAR